MAVNPFMLLAAYALPLGGARLGRLIIGHLVICTLLIFAAGWLQRNVLPAPRPGTLLANQIGPVENSTEAQYAERPPPPGPPMGPNGEPLPLGPGMGPPPQFDPGNPGGGATGPLARPVPVPASLDNFLRCLPAGLPLYVASVLLVSSLNLQRTSLEKERRANELEKQLAAARLEMLRSQLQPHFLFNTLNTLTALVHTNPAQTEEILLSMSSLLRATLEAKDKPLISLRQELQLARDYLSIQAIRYGERLKTEETLPTNTLACAVPPLILQPVLENAIKYAVDGHPQGGTLTLRAERIGEKLVVEIADTGASAGSASREGFGVGVANVRGRLAAAYPGRETAFDLLPNQWGGITARFQMPVTAETGGSAAS
jgi:two-component sensor histidine kinase